MKIVHHFGLRAGEQERAAFLEAGLELPSGTGSLGIVSFEIGEDDARWEKVAALSIKSHLVHAVWRPLVELSRVRHLR